MSTLFSLTRSADIVSGSIKRLSTHQQDLKPLNKLKDDPDFAELNWLSYFILSNAVKVFGKRNHVSTLRSTGVPLPKDGKTGRTPLDYMESP